MNRWKSHKNMLFNSFALKFIVTETLSTYQIGYVSLKLSFNTTMKNLHVFKALGYVSIVSIVSIYLRKKTAS